MVMALCPRKYLIKNLLNTSTPCDVWIQGTIEQTVGSDILIVFDGFGRAKITKCDSADGVINRNSLRKGTMVKSKGLPEIHATKFIDLSSQPQMKEAWETEVLEADLFLEGKQQPII